MYRAFIFLLKEVTKARTQPDRDNNTDPSDFSTTFVKFILIELRSIDTRLLYFTSVYTVSSGKYYVLERTSQILPLILRFRSGGTIKHDMSVGYLLKLGHSS